jgi:hypothetical protein
MVPSSFENENIVFDSPPGMSPDECEPVNAFIGTDPDGVPIVITCWKPTKEELEEIIRTGRIWCYHFGHQLQPHTLSGTSPWQ